MEQENTVPGHESTIAERLEWARNLRGMERPYLIKITMGEDCRSSYTNILKKNLATSKHYPALAKALKINLEWLMSGKGEWEAPEDPAKDPTRIDEALLLACHKASQYFASRFVEDADVQPLELFAMTARLYEESRNLDPSLTTQEHLRKMLYKHYVRAVRSQKE